MLLVIVLVAAMAIAHVGTQLKNAKIVTLISLVTVAVAAAVGVIALFSSFGSDYQGWTKTEDFFIGAAQLAILGGGRLDHPRLLPAARSGAPGCRIPGPAAAGLPAAAVAAARPVAAAAAAGSGPAAAADAAVGSAGAAAGAAAAAQPWGPPPPPPPGQSGFTPPSAESMATQVIPAAPQPPQAPPAPPASEGQHLPPVGNWTAE